MRFVLDTNLLVSGVISAGLPRRLVGSYESIPIVAAREAVERLEARSKA